MQTKFETYYKEEEKLYRKHRIDIGEMLEQNKDRCYEIINRGDGVYFGVLWPPSRHHDAAGLGVYRSLNKSI